MFSTAVVIDAYSTIQGAGVCDSHWRQCCMTWVGDSALRKQLIWRAPYQSSCIFFFFFFDTRQRNRTLERRHHTPLAPLAALLLFYLYGEVCAKNSSKRSSGISANLLRYITEQSIDTLGRSSHPHTTLNSVECCFWEFISSTSTPLSYVESF